MPCLRPATVISLIFMTLCSASCVKVTPPVTVLSEAHQKFLKICGAEFKYEVVLNELSNTLWIYLPVQDNILDYRGTPEGQQKSPDSKLSLTINYIDAVFDQGTFRISYDIEKIKKYSQTIGYKSIYTEDFRTRQNNLLSSVARSYFDVEGIAGDATPEDPQKNATPEQLANAEVPRPKAPEFVFLTLSDIKRGIAVQTILNFQDLKRYMSSAPSISYEEFSHRYLSEVFGKESLIGDKNGDSIPKKDVVLPEFLAKQIENRIKFKYQTSDFPPGENNQDEILKIVSQTVGYYGFADFEAVELKDLAVGKTYLVKSSELPKQE